MLPDYEIVLGRGIGGILFGMPKRELADILGPPDEIEYSDEAERSVQETYYYNSVKCSFSFDPDYGDRLVEIMVENGYFHVGKKIRVGLRKEDLLNSGAEVKFGEFVLEDLGTELFTTHELLSFKKAGLHLWIENGLISAIQISPLSDEQGVILWPEEAGGDI